MHPFFIPLAVVAVLVGIPIVFGILLMVFGGVEEVQPNDGRESE